MDIKKEIEVKNEPLEITDENGFGCQVFVRVSGLEEIEEKNHGAEVNVDSKIKIKEEISNLKDDENNYPGQFFGLDQSQQGKHHSTEAQLDSKIEIKEEFFNQEEYGNDSLGQFSGLNQSQTLTSNAAEGGSTTTVVSFLGSGAQTSAVLDQSINKNYLGNFSCIYCNFSFNSENELKSHVKALHKIKFKCAHCSHESNRKSDLKIHLQIHSKEKLFKCSECDYGCNQKSGLQTHMLKHENIKLFKCFECSYESNRKGDVKLHMLKHRNIKLHKCAECSYECNRKESLKRHMFKHKLESRRLNNETNINSGI